MLHPNVRYTGKSRLRRYVGNNRGSSYFYIGYTRSKIQFLYFRLITWKKCFFSISALFSSDKNGPALEGNSTVYNDPTATKLSVIIYSKCDWFIAAYSCSEGKGEWGGGESERGRVEGSMAYICGLVSWKFSSTGKDERVKFCVLLYSKWLIIHFTLIHSSPIIRKFTQSFSRRKCSQ